MSENVILVGAGGHGKVLADLVEKAGDHVLGFLDDAPAQSEVLGLPVLGPTGDWKKFAGHARFLLAIGSNEARRRLSQLMDVDWYTAVHPGAWIGSGVVLGRGTVVMAGAVINPDARVGCHSIINTGAVVEHDNVIGNFVHVSPHATLCGTVHVGDGTHIGAGAVVRNGISICGGVTVGAGAVVVQNIERPGIYVGVPARERP